MNTGLCTHCRQVNSHSAVDCLECGVRLPWGDAVLEKKKADLELSQTRERVRLELEARERAKVKQANASARANEMKGVFCSNCGTPRSLNANYCAKCGERIRPNYGAMAEAVPAVAPSNTNAVAPSNTNAVAPHELKGVSNGFVWLLAFAPIWGLVLTIFIADVWHISTNSLWWILLVLNSGLCVLDEVHLESQGEEPETGIWTILVPIYLFMRAEKLNQDPTYAWVWMVTFLFSLMPQFVPWY